LQLRVGLDPGKWTRTNPGNESFPHWIFMPPRYRMLAIDVDGTLVNSRDELTPTVCAALRRAAEAGVRLVLATGRRYARALPLVEPLGIETPIVSASGALIKDALDHRTLHQANFDGDDLRKALAVVAAQGFDAVLYADTYAQGFDFFCPRLLVEEPALKEYYELNPGCGLERHDLMTNPPPGIFAGFAMGTKPQMLAVHEALQTAVPEKLYTHVLRSPKYRGFMCEIAPAGATKWSGIRRLADDWGITNDQICAVGDDVNDLPMIVEAGLGVAMENAVDELKQAADRIAPHHDADGLAEVVRWILEES
jgi:5-amino-6-(5-phospho-D-ribitylamino)uracil phosphatase